VSWVFAGSLARFERTTNGELRTDLKQGVPTNPGIECFNVAASLPRDRALAETRESSAMPNLLCVKRT